MTMATKTNHKSKEETMNLTVGTRIYNHGDMANFDHFGMITKIDKNSRFSDQYEITPDDEDLNAYWVYPATFSKEYKGHAGTRIVTEEAYKGWRKAQIKSFTEKSNNRK